MRLVRCDACGAKAILAASQCPKCAEPLFVRNERGDEVRLVNCRSCATYYPATRDGCRWCPAVKRAPVSRRTVKAGVTVLTFAAGWGAWQFRPVSTPQSSAPDVVVLQPTVPRLASVAVVASFARPSTRPAKIQPANPTETQVRESTKPVPTASATTPEPVSTAPEESDSTPIAGVTELVSAKATTWVNVRAEANGTSAIVGIILPDSIVELGELRRGWRRISTRSFSGWAAAKLFTVDTLHR